MSTKMLKDMTAQELIDFRVRTQEEKDAIDEQVRMAKRRAAAEGIYGDGDWLARAEHAAKAKGRLISGIGAEHARRKQGRSDSLEARFMDAARRLLEPDLFHHILSEAKATADGLFPQGVREVSR